MAYITQINTSLRIDYKQHKLKKLFLKKLKQQRERVPQQLKHQRERERERVLKTLNNIEMDILKTNNGKNFI